MQESTLLIIPTLNEQEAISGLIGEAKDAGFHDILVVDGFSTDQTKEIAQNAGANVMLQDFGRGKGCGVRTGMHEFLKGPWKFLCMIDGDGTNIPQFLQVVIEPVRQGKADVVLGSRTRGSRESGSMNLLSLASNRVVSFLLGAKFRRLFTDVQTGYWAFSRRAVEILYPLIESGGFEIEIELFVKAMKAGLRVSETPVGYRRRKGKTKFSFSLRLRNTYKAFAFLSS